jgi:TolB-like protein
LGAPSSERWVAIVPLLDAALELPRERRPAFLAERCAADPGLRRDVERVLAAMDEADSFLTDSASAFVSPLVARIVRQERFAPGDRLGAFRIEREVGRGGMAMVYLARDTRHDRLVALKVLDRELSSTLGADRFIRETAIAARLNHPHILPLFDSGLLEAGAAEPVLYYAMPYVDGRSLRERLREEPRLPIAAALAIALQVAEALDHAHQHGIVHRDIKPENVLLAGEHAFVADFGIALAVDAAGGERLTRTGLSLGTPAYMSPEQATTGRLDGRSDLYSLGCMLYEMLAGRPPFIGATAQAVLAQHAVGVVPLLRTLRSSVPLALERVITRSLAKHPGDRFAAAREFAAALAAAPTAASAPGIASSLAFAALLALQRHRALAAVLAAAVVVGVALAGVRGRLAQPSPAGRPALDRSAVAIAPFRVGAADASLGYLGQGMVGLLTARLSGTEALHTVEPRALLRAWRGMSAGGGDLTESQALALAAQVGAGRLIEGEIVGSGSHLTITSSLIDVASRRTLAQETVESSGDSLPPLLDRLAARLLAIGAGEDQRRLASLNAVPLPALRAYLNGEALVRRGLIDSGATSFEEALRADSTFALAALNLAQTTPWPDVGNAAGEAAWRYRDRLSVEDRANLTVHLGPSYPAVSHSREILEAAEHYVQVAPERPEAWLLLGLRLFEDGPLVGLPEAQGRAAAALARAVALDSTNVPALGSLSVVAAALGDTTGARKALALLRRQQRDSTSPIDFEPAWFLAAVTGDTESLHHVLRRDSLSASLPAGSPGDHGWSMLRLGLHQGLSLRDVDGVLGRALAAAATERQRSNIRGNQGALEAIRGRPRPRREELPVLPRAGETAGPIFGALFDAGDSTGWDSSGAVLLREIGSRRADECCIPRFAAGEYALAKNRLDLAERAATDLRTYHGPSTDDDSATATPISHAYGVILGAQVAARRHDPSAAARLRQLDSVLVNPFELDYWMPCWGNLVAAGLHEARGELGAALAAVRRRSWAAVCTGYVTHHREEGRLAALTGDTVGAIRAYRRYLALRGDAEPRLQPRVLQVRRALAALERASTRR